MGGGGGGGESSGVQIKLLNQNFSRSKILHESSKLEHFQWQYKFRGIKILDLSKV